jgi:hypothetical protein
MAAAIVLSAPFAQQAFSAIDTRWPNHSETIVLAATVVPASAAFAAAVWRIRGGRWWRYALLVLGLGLGVAYYRAMQPIFTETFHFIEYGVLAALFYRAWYRVGDWSVAVLPLLAASIVGSADEWYQWFIPIRVGDARDVGINGFAAVCGLLFMAGVRPPPGAPLRGRSRVRLGLWAAAAVAAFAVFFHTIHMGHDVADPEIGSFRSRFTREELLGAVRDRASRWQRNPPVTQRRVSREDHYLSEGLWHVGRRDEFLEAGETDRAWRENRILETFYLPVLDSPTHADPRGHRWPDAQREDAARRLAADAPEPVVSTEFAYPLYTWTDLF